MNQWVKISNDYSGVFSGRLTSLIKYTPVRAKKSCLLKGKKILFALFENKKDLKTFLFNTRFFSYRNIKVSVHKCGDLWGLYVAPIIDGNKNKNWTKYINKITWDKWEKSYKYSLWEKVNNVPLETVSIKIKTYRIKVKPEVYK